MDTTTTPNKHYPNSREIDAWIDSIWQTVGATECAVTILPEQGFTHNLGIRHTRGFQYIKFEPKDRSAFFGYWQPALSTPAPLLVHVPGYGAEMSAHPDLVAAGFNVLHISPLGYSTPQGADESKMRDTRWPVLPDSILSQGKAGYKLWLADCAMAINWALGQPDVIKNRISFFGTSQGGGGSLLLGSLFKGRGVRCVAADVPFLTDFINADFKGAYEIAAAAFNKMEDKGAAWHAMGLVDTLSHAHRLDIPVLLTAGGADDVCPPHTIQRLFERLPGTRSYTYLKGVEHRYTFEFIPLATAWFRLYA